jgi:hypothetical protein
VKISTTVTDTVGYTLPANQTTITLINPGPQVSSFLPLIGGQTSAFGIVITFSKPIDVSTFGLSNATLIGPNGTVIPMTGLLTSVVNNTTQFMLQFPTQTAPGAYTFKLSGVLDTVGNPMVPFQGQFTLGGTSSSATIASLDTSSLDQVFSELGGRGNS